MDAPSKADRFVKVRAYLTDQDFGYEHWRATQFSSPDGAVFAVLILCHDKAEQQEAMRFLEERAARLT